MSNGKYSRVYSREEILKDKERFAKEFSEGNPMLEQILLFCFNNGIETFGCCAGHLKSNGTTSMSPYIAMKKDETSEAFISNLISKLKDENEISLGMQNVLNRISFTMHFGHNDSDYFWGKILEVLESTKQDEREKYEAEIPKPFSKLQNFLDENGDTGFTYIAKDGLKLYSVSSMYDWQRDIFAASGIPVVERKYRYIIENDNEQELIETIDRLSEGFKKYREKKSTKKETVEDESPSL